MALALLVAPLGGTAQATIVKNSTIAASQAAAFAPEADRVGALVYRNDSTGSNNSMGGTVFMLDEEWGYMTGHSADRNGNGFSNPRITLGDRDLLDGFIGHSVAEIIYHPGYWAGCGTSPRQGECIDVALFRLETPISGISAINIGAGPAVGEQITFFGRHLERQVLPRGIYQIAFYRT